MNNREEIELRPSTTNKEKQVLLNRKSKNRNQCKDYISALIVRIMFAVHACVAFWRVKETDDGFGTDWLWNISLFGQVLPLPIILGGVFFFVEFVLILFFRDGRDFKWCCPCAFAYLLGVQHISESVQTRSRVGSRCRIPNVSIS